MVRILAFSILFIAQMTLVGQDADILFLFNGRNGVIYLTKAPEFGEYIHVSRRKSGNGDFVRLTENKPLVPAQSTDEVRELLQGTSEAVQQYLDAEDLAAVERSIMGNSVRAALSTLLFPEAASAAGRLFVDSSLTANTEYEYKVEYFGSKAKLLSSFTKKVKSIPAQMPAPEKLQGKVSGGLVQLEWKYPKWEADKTNLAVRFNVYRKGTKTDYEKINRKIIIREDNANPVFTEVIPPGSEAEYYITAVDLIGGESKPSASIKLKLLSEVVPEPPLGLKASVIGRAITLSWDIAPSPDIKGYNVYRRDSVRADSVKLTKKELPVSSPFFTDSLARTSVKYYYYVTAVSEAQKESRLSPMASEMVVDSEGPDAPTGLKSSFAGNLVKLEWKASRASDIELYKIFRGEARNILAYIGTSTKNSFIDSGYAGKGLTAGGYYFYAVVPFDKSELAGTASDTLMIRYIDKVPPPPPTPFTATLLQDATVHIRVGMTGVADLASVSIYRRAISTGKELLISTSKKLPFTFFDSSVVFAQKYVYWAESVDSAGNKSKKVTSDTVLIENKITPLAVMSFGAYATNKGVELSWVAIEDSAVIGYNIYRADIANAEYMKINKTPVKGDVYLDAGGAIGTFYKIRAVNNSGKEGEWSEYVAVKSEGNNE